MVATPETKEDRIKILNTLQQKRKQDCKVIVKAALEKMTAEGIKVNFQAVAK